MDQSALTSGTVLSLRYRLEDQIDDSYGATTWLARDLVLDRNVGVQAMEAQDRRAIEFTVAARRSTGVTDPRFLRVLDVVEDEHGFTYLVREWARAVPLDLVLTQSTLTNRRAATVVSEVAEAMGNAHEAGVFHRHLLPGCVLLKESGAVRVVGLAVEHALRSEYSDVDDADVTHAEQVDVESVGKLLYASLAGRWPGGDGGLLRPAPTEHGRLLRPRQVRAGVSRDVDTVCDRILGTPPRHHETRLRSARDIAYQLRLAGEDESAVVDDQPSLIGISSPDLFRHDPVITPSGPPPAVNPPKRRPAALAPPPPTTLQRNKARARRATQGDRALVWTGVVVAAALATVLAFIIGRSTTGETRSPAPPAVVPTAVQQIVPLKPTSITDFDPGGDGSENPELAKLAIDGKSGTSWRTSEYYTRPDLGGLKNGVGLLLDLGSDKQVTSISVSLGGDSTDLRAYVSRPGTTRPPRSVRPLRRAGTLNDAVGGASFALDRPLRARYVVVWLTRLPQKSPGVFQGEVRDIVVRGIS